jgi:hypothetical protein
MGEISRTIGMLGETIVIDGFMKMIGWVGDENIEIRCKSKKHNKRTHGIDFFASYSCPLNSDSQQNICVSVKNTQIPTTDDAIRKKFIEYVDDISTASNCFQKDEIYYELTSHSKKNKQDCSNLIIWLGHSEEDNKSLLECIGKINSTLDLSNNLYFLDNKRLDFIYNSIKFTNNIFLNSQIDFFYPQTGLNNSFEEGRMLSGSILPLQFLNSNVLLFKVTTNDNFKILVVSSLEEIEENSLKRLIGLAQNLTDGWCNKIVIGYPNYRFQEHASLIKKVKLRFQENKFSEMVEIKCYQDSYKSLENPNGTNYQNSSLNKTEIDVETMLPYGDQLRQLLTQSYIFKPDLISLLNTRGLYVNNSLKKGDLIPFLTTSIISPLEFEFLKKRQQKKETSEKINTHKIVIREGADLDELMDSISINLNEIVIEKGKNSKLVKDSIFTYRENGDYSMKFQVTEQNLTKSWATYNESYHGEITVRKPSKDSFGQNCVRIDITSTSADTKKIGNKIIDDFIQHVRTKGEIEKDVEIKKMLASEFTAVQRNEFLFTMIDIYTKKISFFSIVNIEFKPNGDKKLPIDIESLKDKVENSIMSGKNLQEIKYIQDNSYREMFLFSKLTTEYTFDIDGINGLFRVDFGFPNLYTKSDENIDFEFKIIDVIPYVKSPLTIQKSHDLEYKIKEEFNKIKIAKYENVERKYGKQLELNLK